MVLGQEEVIMEPIFEQVMLNTLRMEPVKWILTC